MSSERLWSLGGGLNGLPAVIAGWMSAGLLGLLSAAAVVLAARRLGGALPHPLDPAALLAVAAMVATAALTIRLSWPIRSPAGFVGRTVWMAMVGATLATVALGAAVSVRGTHAAATFALWTILGLEEVWAWQRFLRQAAGAAPHQAGRFWRPNGPALAAGTVGRADTVLPVVQPARRFHELPPDDVLQKLVRGRAADGHDTLSGFARIVFARRQRSGSIHVAFCPPFARTPEFSVDQIDGPEARIKTGQLLPYGVRLDLKLVAEAELPTNVLLQFVARNEVEKGSK